MKRGFTGRRCFMRNGIFAGKQALNVHLHTHAAEAKKLAECIHETNKLNNEIFG